MCQDTDDSILENDSSPVKISVGGLLRQPHEHPIQLGATACALTHVWPSCVALQLTFSSKDGEAKSWPSYSASDWLVRRWCISLDTMSPIG